ncbi:MAG: hypothetical protein K2I75_04945 [Clostridiales bacterium]|nr:hypothetical protein [Clostridiales bacterium]
MDKEKAERLINRATHPITIRKLTFLYAFICIVAAGVCFALNKETVYITVTAIMLCSVVILCIMACILHTIIIRKRLKYEYCKMIFMVLIICIFCVLLNIMMYGIYKHASSFVWWIYIVLIVFEVAALIITLPVIIFFAERISGNKRMFRMTKGIAFTSASLGHGIGELTIFLFQPSDDAILYLLISLICFIGSILCGVIDYLIYRAYLIKKFDV